jgi:hypothetical protein
MKYTLMHKEIPVADIGIDDITHGIFAIHSVYHQEHFPIGVVNRDGKIDVRLLNHWWTGRGIPASRSGLRDALEALRVTTAQELLTKGFGLSLSDQYWVCSKDNDLKWRDINFFDNDFSPDVGNALFGRKNGTKELNLMSPDNTSDGWLKKRWIIHEGKRKLLKAGSPPYYQEPFNEVLVSVLCKKMNIPHVEYTLVLTHGEPLSVCENFIDTHTELVSAWYIAITDTMKSNSSKYQHFNSCCRKLRIEGMKDHIEKMITVDYIIANTDRHYNNFGAIRNAGTLAWAGPAPLFDSGTSLWYNMDFDMIKPDYKITSKPFRSNHRDQIKLVDNFDWLDFDSLQTIDEEFEGILKSNEHIKKARRDVLCAALKTRVKNLRHIVIHQTRERSSGYEDFHR